MGAFGACLVPCFGIVLGSFWCGWGGVGRCTAGSPASSHSILHPLYNTISPHCCLHRAADDVHQNGMRHVASSKCFGLLSFALLSLALLIALGPKKCLSRNRPFLRFSEKNVLKSKVRKRRKCLSRNRPFLALV